MFDDLINQMMSNMASIGEIKLAVVNTKPLGPVKITENTSSYITQLSVDVVPYRKDSLENWIGLHT